MVVIVQGLALGTEYFNDVSETPWRNLKEKVPPNNRQTQYRPRDCKTILSQTHLKPKNITAFFWRAKVYCITVVRGLERSYQSSLREGQNEALCHIEQPLIEGHWPWLSVREREVFKNRREARSCLVMPIPRHFCSSINRELFSITTAVIRQRCVASVASVIE